MEHEDENYDFEERAAIREFDGDQPRGTAEFFAREEIAARTAQQGCLAHRKKQPQAPVVNHCEPGKIRQPFDKAQDRPEKPLRFHSGQAELQGLQDQRDEVGRQMRAETNEQRKNELRAEWMKLTNRIIELRKIKDVGN